MTEHSGELWIVRHGQTEWSRDGRHTSRTDVPLTSEGETAAKALGERLAEASFDLVLTSPRVRARRTAELAGFAGARIEGDLVEWDYGDYEGLTTPEIREQVPAWTVWSGHCPGGESAEEIGRRLDRVVAQVRGRGGRVLCFGHGHASRVLAMRWLGQPARNGRMLKLDPTTISVLSYEHESPAVARWNG